MHLDVARISVSLAKVAFTMGGAATRLIIAEQDGFLDGHQNVDQYGEARDLLDTLVDGLEAPPSPV